jgi:serine/threonine-protein kinase
MEAERAFQNARDALAGYESAHPDDPDYFQLVAKIHAGLGQRAEAVAAAERAVALMPMSKVAMDGIWQLKQLAEVRAFLGEADAAIPLIRQLLTMPGAGRDLSPALLRLDPIWDPIRYDSRFRELSAEETKP